MVCSTAYICCADQKQHSIKYCEKDFEGKKYKLNVLLFDRILQGEDAHRKTKQSIASFRYRIVHNNLQLKTISQEEYLQRIGECRVDLYLVELATNKKSKLDDSIDFKPLLDAGTHTLKAKVTAQYK